MTTKEKVSHAVRDLPDDAAVDEVIDRLLLLAKIERGLARADAGQTLTQHDAQQRMAKWPQQDGRVRLTAYHDTRGRPRKARGRQRTKR